MDKPVIGFIGTGVMGKGMIRNLIKGGYSVNIYNRTKEKALDLVDDGARWFDTISSCTQASDVVVTMVGYPKDVKDVYFKDGILNHAKKGSYVIDMTTSSPALAEDIYNDASSRGIHALDAPVSGGDIGAQKGTLSIMIGGEKSAFDKLKPIFEAMGENIVYQGKAGSGQHTKMCNQITIASNMMGVCEALAYAKRAGLNEEQVLKSITSGAAGSWSLSNLAPRMLEGDFKPGFYVKHFIKDMTIALETAKEMGLMTPGLESAKKLYEELAENGEENSGTQVLYKSYL
ncbi:3-hydroxyisobutyrate dehydrogenase [Scopulibacillus darangshiensis]|uniref:3-hydroxyisobutyrate dehydrogenase n=2 Tax=Scopulibacillus darangshiensis TaxID=442528 RepID=A0A4R2NI03_9BACL|nr:NAD(P)-dependent oxidoreductase [Scopulibacillus darangshiensis]TCP20960.1 3-hydroxyisobutyrate dehydrogenase [Scopulibacillus darangshiensis]